MSRTADRRATRPAGFRELEKHVIQRIIQRLRLKGWVPIHTPAEAVLPGGGKVYGAGQADYAFVRRDGDDALRHDRETEFFWLEAKKPKANTKPARRIAQAAFQDEMNTRGLLAYRAPDGCADVEQDFENWYRCCIGEAL